MSDPAIGQPWDSTLPCPILQQVSVNSQGTVRKVQNLETPFCVPLDTPALAGSQHICGVKKLATKHVPT